MTGTDLVPVPAQEPDPEPEPSLTRRGFLFYGSAVVVAGAIAMNKPAAKIIADAFDEYAWVGAYERVGNTVYVDADGRLGVYWGDCAKPDIDTLWKMYHWENRTPDWKSKVKGLLAARAQRYTSFAVEC